VCARVNLDNAGTKIEGVPQNNFKGNWFRGEIS